MGEILFSMNPEVIDKVETKFRRIVTSIPVPESLPIIEKLQQYEPLSMSGQPLVVWDRAKGVNVYDSYGNKWFDVVCACGIRRSHYQDMPTTDY